jgi:hypothetical protein
MKTVTYATEGNPFDSYNGGTWSLGDTYAGGWFWRDNAPAGSCANWDPKAKRDGALLNVDEANLNFTLANGETQSVDKRVWLDLSDLNNPRVVEEVSFR